MPTYLRSDQASIHAIIGPAHLPAVKSWSSLKGGDLESEDTKIRPGGMVGQVNLGGPTTRTDATIERPYTRELHPYIKTLENLAGTQGMSATYTILDVRGNVVGPTVTLRGILKNVIRPEWDANATAAAMLGVVMGCDVEASIA